MPTQDNAADQHEDDLLVLSLLLLRFQASQGRAAILVLQELLTELLVELTRADLTGARTAIVQQRRLKKYLQAIRTTIRAKYAEIAATQSKSLQGLAKLEFERVLASINQIMAAPVANVRLNTAQLNELVRDLTIQGAPLKDAWMRQADEAFRKVSDRVRDGLLRGHSKGEIEAAIKGTKFAGYADGLARTIQQRADTLARTAANRVANEARLQAYEQNPELIRAIMWQSIIDQRTTTICLGLHQKEWELPDYKPIGHDKEFPGPAPHYNCRSSQIAIFKAWDGIKTAKVLTADGGTASIDSITRKAWAENKLTDDEVADIQRRFDGKLPRRKSFEAWLASKPASFQDEILGKGRAKLFRDGKITINDLTDQTSRPLTIAELESRFGT